jgi:hypothetical protein
MKALKRKMRMSVKAPLGKRGWRERVLKGGRGGEEGRRGGGKGKVDEEKKRNSVLGGGGLAGFKEGRLAVRERVDRERLAVGPSIAYRGAKSGTVFISRDLGKLSGLGDSRTQGGGGAGNWELGTPPSPAPPRRDPPAATHFSFLPPQPILSKLSLSLSLSSRPLRDSPVSS